MRALIQRLAAEASEVALGAQGAQGVQPAPGPWSTVMVVGAGGCSEWGLLRRLQAQRLVLVEPQQRLADDLLRLTRGDPCAEVWPLALVPQGDEATLLLLNMARESGTAAPTALSVHYPRAGLAQRQTVPARPIEQALQSLTLDPEQRHLLVLDTPGQALGLLQAAPAPLLQAFETVIVRMGVEALYDSDTDALAVSAYLESVGFEAREEDREAIFPHTAWRYGRNVQHVRLLQLQADAAQAQTDLQEARDRIAAQEQELAQAQGALAAQLEAVKTLEALLLELTVFQKALSSERDALAEQRDGLENEKNQLTGQRDTLAGEKSQLTGQRDALVGEKAALIEERNALAGQRDALAGEKAALTDERNGLAAQRDGLAKEKADLIAARDALANEKNQLVGQRDGLAKEKADLIAARDALAKEKGQLVSQLDGLAKEKAAVEHSLNETLQQLESTRSENQELGNRQQLMQEELVKAEAQIELIKDLLLREPSL